jgi:multidrug efflux pump subunit AcrB
MFERSSIGSVLHHPVRLAIALITLLLSVLGGVLSTKVTSNLVPSSNQTALTFQPPAGVAIQASLVIRDSRGD